MFFGQCSGRLVPVETGIARKNAANGRRLWPCRWRLLQEFAFGVDDRNLDVIQSGMVGGAVAQLQAAHIEVPEVVECLDDFGARDRAFAAGATQPFDQHLGAYEPFKTGIRRLNAPPSLASFWNSRRTAWLVRRGFGSTWVTITPRAFAPSCFTNELDELFDKVMNWVVEPAARAPISRCRHPPSSWRGNRIPHLPPVHPPPPEMSRLRPRHLLCRR